MLLTDKAKKVLDETYKYWLDEGNGRYAAITPFLFTCAIIDGRNEHAEFSYDRRWCYSNANDALGALAEWATRNFEEEPQGWHRAVDGTGRRRPHGNKEEEYIEF